jgi:hypothetical protein
MPSEALPRASGLAPALHAKGDRWWLAFAVAMAGAALPWAAGCDEVLGVQEGQVTVADGGPGSEAGSGALVTLAAGLSDPLGITLDDTNIYWVEGESSDGGSGSVNVMPKSGGVPKTLVESQPSPLDIAFGDPGLYWSINTANQPAGTQCMVMMMKSPTMPVTKCVTESPFATTRMALTKSYVVVLTTDPDNNSHIGFAPRAAEAAYTSVLSVSPARAVAATDTIGLVGDGAHVDDYALPGLGMGMAVYQGPGPWQVTDITLDSVGDAFWAASDGNTGQVATGSYSKLDMMGTVLANKLPGAPQRIAIGGSYVYVTLMAGPTSGIIEAIEKTGVGVRQLAILDDCAPYGIAVDATRIYWTCTNGSIQSIEVPPAP